MKTLEKTENLYGELRKESANRIKAYVTAPTTDKWDDISSVIVNSKMTTIWQAVLDIDSSFPKQGRVYNEKDEVIQEWKEIPTPLQVLSAIKEATK